MLCGLLHQLSGFSFGDDIESVDGGGWGDLLFCAIRPADLDGVDFCRGAKAEVRALVGARGETAAGKDIGTLAKAVGGEVDNGSYGVTGRLRAAYEFESNPVIRRGNWIAGGLCGRRGGGTDDVAE